MSRDDPLTSKLERLKRAHRSHIDDRRRDMEQVHKDVHRALKDREEAQRAADQARREREAARARRSGRRPLDAASIASAAVAIADAQGVEEVSMRKIAAVLGSGTMSLYHYVRTKEDLFAAMDDIIMGEILVTPRELKGGWRSAMKAIANHTRDAYRRHPWALTIQTKGGQPGVNGLRHVEQSLAALDATGLSFEDKFAVIVVVDDFVFGHALRARENALLETVDDVTEISSFMEGQLDPESFPALTKAMEGGSAADLMRRMVSSFQPDEWFQVGLDAILDGLSRRLDIDD